MGKAELSVRISTGIATLPSGPQESVGSRRWPSQVAAVFAISLVAAAIFGWLVPFFRNPDYVQFYEPVSRSLLAGRGYTTPDGRPAVVFPPGYPLTLAGLFAVSDRLGIAETRLLSLANMFWMALSTVALFLLARPVLGFRRALAAVLLWATYPFALYLTAFPATELPFLVLFFGALALLVRLDSARSRSLALHFSAGALLGLGMLLRPIAVGTGVLAAALIFVAGRAGGPKVRAALAAAVLAGNLVALLPWQTWVYHQTGRLIVLGSNGVPSIVNGLDFGASTGRAPVRLPRDVQALMEQIHSQAGQIRSLGDVGSRLAGFARRDPAAVLKLMAIKAIRPWYGTDSRTRETPIAMLQAAYLIAIAAGARVAWRCGGEARRLVVGIVLFGTYYWAMSFMVLPLLRYMIPAMGLLFLLAAAALPERFVRTGREKAPVYA